MSIDIGGTAANQYGHLSVTGAATLSGTLNLAATGGFDPALGATFPFLTCGSRTGQWTTVNGNTGTGKQFTVTYGPTSATATVAAPAPPARITSTPIDSAQGVPVPGAGSIRPGDTLQLSTLVRDAEGARFRFPTAAGRKDRLEGTADLASGQWTVLLDHLEGGGEVLELLDTEAATLASYFSRILLLP